ncbi:MAG: HD domain-containing protein [Treponema sp.]|jgi:HD-GYP domain-containing protein (c-di-GMP phosphodiesterase class II)|nr:HD domain-containing protein [Treponema sp.]
MNYRMDKLIQAIAEALDIVEGELLGATTYHGKRIAVLCAAMGRRLGMGKAQLTALTSCALLHDNALTEYIRAELEGGAHDPAMKLHCQQGQRNADTLGFETDMGDFILYHHERANGSGPYGKRAGEYSLGAELIGIADATDVTWRLQRVSPEELPLIRSWLAQDGEFRPAAMELLLAVLDAEALDALKDTRIIESAEETIPAWNVDGDSPAIFNMASFISQIIDYKSAFTRRHSMGIVDKARIMGGYYGYDPPLLARLCLAAGLHDIGKLAVPTAILEKTDRLNDEEYLAIMEHVRGTAELLKDIDGFEDIRNWASNHHEKLDGSGYPLGKKAGELDFNSRLMTCIDIYQAVSEERPYHPARSHRDTMDILYDMAGKGALDETIVRDMDLVFGPRVRG